jgi:hypothetical protein
LYFGGSLIASSARSNGGWRMGWGRTTGRRWRPVRATMSGKPPWSGSRAGLSPSGVRRYRSGRGQPALSILLANSRWRPTGRSLGRMRAHGKAKSPHQTTQANSPAVSKGRENRAGAPSRLGRGSACVHPGRQGGEAIVDEWPSVGGRVNHHRVTRLFLWRRAHHQAQRRRRRTTRHSYCKPPHRASGDVQAGPVPGVNVQTP